MWKWIICLLDVFHNHYSVHSVVNFVYCLYILRILNIFTSYVLAKETSDMFKVCFVSQCSVFTKSIL
jgi:hypothetical protein